MGFLWFSSSSSSSYMILLLRPMDTPKLANLTAFSFHHHMIHARKHYLFGQSLHWQCGSLGIPTGSAFPCSVSQQYQGTDCSDTSRSAQTAWCETWSRGELLGWLQKSDGQATLDSFNYLRFEGGCSGRQWGLTSEPEDMGQEP